VVRHPLSSIEYGYWDTCMLTSPSVWITIHIEQKIDRARDEVEREKNQKMMKRIPFCLTIRKDCAWRTMIYRSNCLAQIINAANPACHFPCEELPPWHWTTDPPILWATKQTPWEMPNDDTRDYLHAFEDTHHCCAMNVVHHFGLCSFL